MSDEGRVDESRLRALFRALAEHEVEYAVFGAVALGLHGLVRATADVDLFLSAGRANVEALKQALRLVFGDSSIDEIGEEDLCGEYPVIRYVPPVGFGLDIVTRVGTAFRYEDLEVEVREYDGVPVRVVTPETLWKLKKDSLRPIDRIDAAALAERFGFKDS